MIYTLKTNETIKITDVGGKGLALIETTKAGFPVPEGIVLSVGFFATWLEKVKKSESFCRVMTDITKDNCEAVKVLAEEMTFDDKQMRLFSEAMKELEGSLFAVRSSSPEEDLEGTSFAGMYETFLGQTQQTLEKSIVKAFASCFDYRVMAYKAQNKIDLMSTAIAVVIQRQIASDVSGVGFSLNPMNNSYDEVMINASFGLGEAIVSGLVTPDTYIYDAVLEKIISKKVNVKEMSLQLADDGGIREKANDNMEEQALTDEQIVELSKMIKSCEAYYKKPIDTEWAFENNKLYLLQARPITTYFPLNKALVTTANEPLRFYIDMLMLTQGISEPMSVLGMDVWKKLIFVTKSGLLSTDINGTAPVIGGKEYLSVTAYQKVLGKTAGRKALATYDGNIKRIFNDINLEEHTFEGKPAGTEGYMKRSLGKAFGMLPELGRALFGDVDKIVSDYLDEAASYQAIIDAQDSRKPFDETVGILMDGFEVFMGKLAPIFIGMMAQKGIEKLFGDEADLGDIVALNMDLDGNPTSEMGKSLYRMASSDYFKVIDSKETFIEMANNHSFSDGFQKQVDRFVVNYGMRGIREIDVATERVYEDMGKLYDLISDINLTNNQHESVTSRREAAYERLLQLSKSNGKEKKFIKAASRLKSTFGYREYPKYMLVKALSKLHQIGMELGKEFVSQGRLKSAEDIFDLSVDEVTNAQNDITLNLNELRANQLDKYKNRNHIKEWPLVIDSRGKIYRPAIEISDGDIKGDAIAPGKVIGKAKVLMKPYEKTLEPGEILVTRATEPSWTPIFTNAAGVVMEIGGPLQHGGIIAREYGIPCVSGLVGITKVLKDGDIIEVDGTNGRIRVIEEVE